MSNFQEEIQQRLSATAKNDKLSRIAASFMSESIATHYSYNFFWLGRPIIQYPQDMVAIQEIIWKTKPDLIIETGIAHGGSLILSASMLAMIDMCEAIETGVALDPVKSRRKVLGVDIDIRDHNRKAIEAHPMASRIQMIQGSSIAPEIIEQVRRVAEAHTRIMVCLDSNHTHAHVHSELEAYAPMTSIGCYCVVFDTIIEDLPADMFPDRPWGRNNNPKTAVQEYLKTTAKFRIDHQLDNKLILSVAQNGYLQCLA